jgi:hypothetical protein
MTDAGTTKHSAAKDRASPTHTKGTGGDRGWNPPEQQEYDRKYTYQRQQLRSIDSEASPSAGWRAVYAEMGVSVDE